MEFTMFRDLDKYLTYASILGIIIPTVLIFRLKIPDFHSRNKKGRTRRPLEYVAEL